jgi:hypothetical protein
LPVLARKPAEAGEQSLIGGTGRVHRCGDGPPEWLNPSAGRLYSGGTTSIQLLDITSPAAPRVAANWTERLAPDSGVGCSPNQFTHSARFEDGGRSLCVSYWDAGTVHLNIADPASPVIVSQTKIVPPDEAGDNHSMTLANGGKWLVINTEDYSPGDCPGRSEFGGWGEVYVYDNIDPTRPTFLGTFSTPNSRSTRSDGVYTDHNTEMFGNDQFFSSWYSDGVVWWTMDGHGVSRQLGQFVPSGTPGVPPEVWGVYVTRPIRSSSPVISTAACGSSSRRDSAASEAWSAGRHVPAHALAVRSQDDRLLADPFGIAGDRANDSQPPADGLAVMAGYQPAPAKVGMLPVGDDGSHPPHEAVLAVNPRRVLLGPALERHRHASHDRAPSHARHQERIGSSRSVAREVAIRQPMAAHL